MKRLSILAVVLAGAATISLAQSSPAPQPTVAAGQSGLSPSLSNGSGMQISTGRVTEYTAGQKIAVRVGDDDVIQLDLDKNVHVDGLVQPGLLAAVMWTGDAAGKRRVMSITAAPGPGDAGMANLESSYQHMSDPVKGKGAVTPGRPATSGGATPGRSATSPPTILTPQATTPRATPTPSTPSMPRPSPTPIP